MSLPIIMIFERHFDETPKNLLKYLIPQLSQEGYNTLCFEAGSSLTEAEVISSITHNLDADSKLYAQAVNYLKRANINIEGKLSDVSFTELTQLMKFYVSSKHFVEVAEKIKNLPAGLLLKNILEISKNESFTIKGVDSGTDLQKILSYNILERAKSVLESETRRIQSMSDNLLKLYNEKKGIIFSCGALHSKNLIAKLKENGLKDHELICYFPHSSKSYDSGFNDIEEMKKELLDENIICLESNNEINLLSQKIISEIKLKNNHCREEILDGNSQSQFLTQFFNVPFKAFLRPGYHVDALLLKSPEIDFENILKKLHEATIQTHSIVIKEEHYLVILNVNNTDIAHKIHGLR